MCSISSFFQEVSALSCCLKVVCGSFMARHSCGPARPSAYDSTASLINSLRGHLQALHLTSTTLPAALLYIPSRTACHTSGCCPSWRGPVSQTLPWLFSCYTRCPRHYSHVISNLIVDAQLFASNTHYYSQNWWLADNPESMIPLLSTVSMSLADAVSLRFLYYTIFIKV